MFSAKRQQELTGNSEQLPVGATNCKTLVSICWVARIEAFAVFHVVLPTVSKTFDIISSDRSWNAESSQKAASLLLSLTQFQFLMVLVVVENCLGYTKGVTVSLQSQSIDICTAYREANTVRAVLAEVQDNINHHHKQWYDTAVELSEKYTGLHHPFHGIVVDRHSELTYWQKHPKSSQ